jgi:hypothetical protein
MFLLRQRSRFQRDGSGSPSRSNLAEAGSCWKFAMSLRLGRLPVWCVLGLLITSGATAQLNSNINNVTVNGGSPINFTLVPNTAFNAGSATTSITTAWVLKPGRTTVAVWAYFGSATQALVHQTVGNTTDIPSAAVLIQYNGSGPFNALTNVSPFNAATSGLQLGPAIAIKDYNKNSSRTDTLAYSIDTTVVPQLQADTYVGTMNIQAQAIP